MITRLSRRASAKRYIDSAELRLLLDSIGEAIYEMDMLGNCAFCTPSEFQNCGKLLKANRGEVAERLNAAVC